MMISVIAQERLLGAALGSTFAGIVVFEQRRRIYNSIRDFQSEGAAQSKVREPIFGSNFSSDLALVWNRSVDQVFVPVIESLGSRKW